MAGSSADIKGNLSGTPFSHLEKYAVEYLLMSGFSKVDYVSIADASTLCYVSGKTSSNKLVALIAAFIGDVRLIDNIVLTD